MFHNFPNSLNFSLHPRANNINAANSNLISLKHLLLTNFYLYLYNVCMCICLNNYMYVCMYVYDKPISREFRNLLGKL